MKSWGDEYPYLKWALELNPRLEEVLEEIYGDRVRYFEYLNSLFKELKNANCEGIREKIKETPDSVRFNHLLSEFIVGKIFVKKGKIVEFLPDSYMGNIPSPDICVADGQLKVYVEVKLLTDDETDKEMLEFLREFLKDKPFRVDVREKRDFSLPAVYWKERGQKHKWLNDCLEQFKDDFEKLLEDPGPRRFPITIDTDCAIFEVHPTKSKKGYPGIMTSGFMGVPVDYYQKKIKKDLLVKARKREQWSGEDRKIPYIIALHYGDPFFDVHIEDFLLGRRTEIIVLELEPLKSQHERVRDEEWKKITGEPGSIIPKWKLIEKAVSTGWEEFLIEKAIIPNDYTYITEAGICLTEDGMKNVSGVMTISPGEGHYFIPNPFAEAEINDTRLIDFC